MTLIDISKAQDGNPLDVVERMATTQQWSFERVCEDEVTIAVRGNWADYQVSFTWMPDMEALHLACAFELKVPERSKVEVQHLVPMINAQMWEGHFDLWLTDGLVMFRHAHLLSGGVRRRIGSARCCCGQPSTHASGTTRPSSLWPGPARARTRRSKRSCSRPLAPLELVVHGD